MSTDISTLNLNDDSMGMVTLQPSPQQQPHMPTQLPPPPQQMQDERRNFASNFIQENNNIPNNQKEPEMMDSTPISDLMPEPPADPRMQGVMPQMTAPQTNMYAQQPMMMPQADEPEPKKKSENPLNLTDEQMTALVVAACAAAAVSKPVQDKLVTSVPKFLNEQGGRSMVGLASTGLVAAVLFYFIQNYVMKN
jgi:hypothetical protein